MAANKPLAHEPTGGVRMVLVSDDRAGQRLDNFLLGLLKGAPRSIIYRILRTGQVRVNGGRAKRNPSASRGSGTSPAGSSA